MIGLIANRDSFHFLMELCMIFLNFFLIPVHSNFYCNDLTALVSAS